MMHAFGGKWWENDIPDAFGRISAEKPPGAVLLDSAGEHRRDDDAARPRRSAARRRRSTRRSSRTTRRSRTTSCYQQLMWSGLMVLQTEKENPEYCDKLDVEPVPDRRLEHRRRTRRGSRAASASRSRRPPKNAELAFDFSKFVASAENAENFIGGGGQPPNTGPLTEWSTKPGFQVFETLATGIISGHHQAQFPEGGEFYDIISNATAIGPDGREGAGRRLRRHEEEHRGHAEARRLRLGRRVTT